LGTTIQIHLKISCVYFPFSVFSLRPPPCCGSVAQGVHGRSALCAALLAQLPTADAVAIDAD